MEGRGKDRHHLMNLIQHKITPDSNKMWCSTSHRKVNCKYLKGFISYHDRQDEEVPSERAAHVVHPSEINIGVENNNLMR